MPRILMMCCRKVKDIQVPGQIQYLSLTNERLIVGYPSVFALYTVQGSGAPLGTLSLYVQSYPLLYYSPHSV